MAAVASTQGASANQSIQQMQQAQQAQLAQQTQRPHPHDQKAAPTDTQAASANPKVGTNINTVA
jgi:hypothetical protein